MLSAAPFIKILKNPADRSLIDQLNSAIRDGGAKERQRILERITDLFAAGSRGYSGEQIAFFDDILQDLTADIEVKARARLAHRMARINNAPPRLIRSLAFDDVIEVAEPVLVHSQQLCDSDLIENAGTKSQNHLFAIAQRLKLTERVTDVLVDRGDRRVVHKLVTNRGARFSLAGYGKLSVRAQHDRKLTLALGQREDLPRQYFLRLLETASASVRGRLEAANPRATAAVRNAIDDVATEMQQEARKASSQYATAMRETKRLFNVRPAIEADVHGRAKAQEFDKTVIALAKLGRFPIDLVERALLDKGEEIILILAKAAGCSWATVKELLLMYVAKRNFRPDELTRTFERYKALSETTARKVINFYSQRMKLRAQNHASDHQVRI